MKKLLLLLFISVPFIVSAQKCKFRRTIDKFTSDTTYTSMIGPQFFLTKTFRNSGEVETTAFFKTTGHTPTFNGNSVILLLENGEKVELPATIDVSVNRGGATPYSYTALVPMDDEVIGKLSQNKITDFRVYIFDSKIGKIYQNIIQNHFLCALAEDNKE